MTHAMSCDAAHCLNRHTVLNDCRLSQDQLLAISRCHGNGLGWYPATNAASVQHFNLRSELSE